MIFDCVRCDSVGAVTIIVNISVCCVAVICCLAFVSYFVDNTANGGEHGERIQIQARTRLDEFKWCRRACLQVELYKLFEILKCAPQFECLYVNNSKNKLRMEIHSFVCSPLTA